LQDKGAPEDHALTEETIAATAAMPTPTVLFKRCRQIGTVMLRLLRKGRCLKVRHVCEVSFLASYPSTPPPFFYNLCRFGIR